MFQRRLGELLVLGLILCLPSAAARAGNDDPPPLGGKKPEKPAAQDENRGGGDRRAEFADRMLENMTRELNLTKEQQTKIREIVRKNADQMRGGPRGGPGGGGGERPAANPENAEKMKKLREAMAQAREAGDREKLDALRKQMQELGGGGRGRGGQGGPGGGFGGPGGEMMQQINEVLTPEQREKFSQMRPMMGGGRGGAANPRALRDAVMKLDLGKDQKTKIEAIFEKSKDSFKDAGEDRRAQMGAMRELHDAVVKELTAEQAKKLETALQDGGRRGMRRGGDQGDDNAPRRARRGGDEGGEGGGGGGQGGRVGGG